MSVAIIGTSQEAAEIFEDLSKRRGQHTATMFVEDSALRPEVNLLELEDSQSNVLPPEIRHRVQCMHSTSPCVSIATLESLYLTKYNQQIAEPDASKWRFRIEPLSEVVDIREEQGKARLVVRNTNTGVVDVSARAFDMVIAATGYDSAVDQQLVAPMVPLLDGGAISVDREYRVNFRRNTLTRDCGIWLLGSLGDSNRRGDDFSYMAERGHRVAKSVLEQHFDETTQKDQQVEQAVL